MPKISELPLANKLKEEDYIPIVQDGVTKKVKGTHFVTEEEYSLDAFSPTIAANDKAMYKFGEGDSVDFSDSAYDGAYKSAILKGMTLVNCYKITESTPYTYKKGSSPLSKLTVNLSANKTYLILLDFSTVDKDGKEKINFYPISTFTDETTKQESNFAINGNGRFVYKYTPSKDVKDYRLVIGQNNFENNNPTVVLESVMIIEYQQGMENWDIPYFEGMQSVRMPVLCTTGKNLFDKSKVKYNTTIIAGNGQEEANNLYMSSDFISVKPNENYISNNMGVIFFYNENRQYIGEKNNGTVPQKFTTPVNCKYIRVRCWAHYSEVEKQKEVVESEQIEQDSTVTTYEPYKTNILSCDEEVTLHGIGDVQDTLDCLTGQVTQRFNEIVIDGTIESIINIHQPSNSELITFRLDNVANDGIIDIQSMSDKLLWNNASGLLNYPYSFRLAPYGNPSMVRLFICLPKSILSEESANGLMEWLANNPVKIQYPLATPVVKTVDLSGTPFGYKGGHIIKSSAEGSLLPKFEYEVAVSRGAQISQNTSTLIKHDEKITELLKKTATTYINQKAEIAHLLNMSNTLEEVQTIPFIEDDYVNDDCMVDSDMVMDDMELEPEEEIIDNVDTLLINLIYDLIELNDTLDLSEKVELFRQSGLIDKHNYEIIKEKLNPTFKEEDYADINQ